MRPEKDLSKRTQVPMQFTRRILPKGVVSNQETGEESTWAQADLNKDKLAARVIKLSFDIRC